MIHSNSIKKFSNYNFNTNYFTTFSNYSAFELLDIYQSNEDFVFFDTNGNFVHIKDLHLLNTNPSNYNGNTYFYNNSRLELMNKNYSLNDDNEIFTLSENDIFIINFGSIDIKKINNKYKQVSVSTEQSNNVKLKESSNISDNDIDNYYVFEDCDSFGYDYCVINNKDNDILIHQLINICENNKNIIGFNSFGFLKYYIEPNKDNFIKKECKLYIHKSRYNDFKNKLIEKEKETKYIRYYNEYLGDKNETNILLYNRKYTIDPNIDYQSVLGMENYDYNIITDGTKIPGIVFDKSLVFKTNSLSHTRQFLNQVNIHQLNTTKKKEDKFKFIFDSNSYMNMVINKSNNFTNYPKHNNKTDLLLLCVHESYMDTYKEYIDIFVMYLVNIKIKCELFVFKDNYYLEESYDEIKEKIKNTYFVMVLDVDETNYI